MSFFRKLLARVTRTLSGETRTMEHPYFGHMTYFVFEDPVKRFWEAQLEVPGSSAEVTVLLAGTPEGPTIAEEQFCRHTLSDVDALFERCRDAFREPYREWTGSEMPAEWRTSFAFEGFDVPANGDPAGEWLINFFVEEAGHTFVAVVTGDQVRDVRVEG